MASTKKEGLLTKLIKFVFTIACIVLLIVVIVGIQTVTTIGNWVSNVSVGSFDTAQFADLKEESPVPFLDGVTFGDLGINPTEDTVFDVVRLVMTLADGLKVEESEIADDPVKDEDTTSVEEKVEQLLPEGDGYLSILENPITTVTPEQIVYTPNEIAALCNIMIGEADSSSNSNVQYLADLNATVRQISLHTENGEKQVKIVLSIDIASIKSQIDGSLPPFIADRLGDTLYMTFVGNLSVDANGVLDTETQSLVLNNFNQQQSDLVLSVVGSVVGLEVEGSVSQYFGDTLGGVFDKIINNLGKVGVLSGSIETYSIDAIDVENNQIKLVTHVA